MVYIASAVWMCGADGMRVLQHHYSQLPGRTSVLLLPALLPRSESGIKIQLPKIGITREVEMEPEKEQEQKQKRAKLNACTTIISMNQHEGVEV